MGNSVHFPITDAQVHDCKAAILLLFEVKINESNILAYRVYGTDEIRNYISEYKADYTTPPKSNNSAPWFYDFWLYKERHLVECLFNKIKAFRRVAARYDKLATSFLAFVYVASIWLLSK